MFPCGLREEQCMGLWCSVYILGTHKKPFPEMEYYMIRDRFVHAYMIQILGFSSPHSGLGQEWLIKRMHEFGLQTYKYDGHVNYSKSRYS